MWFYLIFSSIYFHPWSFISVSFWFWFIAIRSHQSPPVVIHVIHLRLLPVKPSDFVIDRETNARRHVWNVSPVWSSKETRKTQNQSIELDCNQSCPERKHNWTSFVVPMHKSTLNRCKTSHLYIWGSRTEICQGICHGEDCSKQSN